MHERTYADESVAAYQDKFVWILVDPSVSMDNEDVMDEYSMKLEEELDGFLLALPTVVFLDADGKIVHAETGKVKPEEFIGFLEQILGE